MLTNKFCPAATLLRGLIAASLLSLGSRVPAANAQQAGLSHRALSETKLRIVFDSAFLSGPNTPIPHWENGYLVTREIETFSPNFANVRLYDKTGRKAREALIWFPEATRVLVDSAAVTSDGRIVASGTVDKADGTVAPYIALTDLGGKMTDVIQTGDFGPASICVAPDGTVWSFGGMGYDAQTRRPRPGGTLRHFDFQKGQLATYLPRSTFPDHPLPEAVAHIRCSSTQVVVYSPQGGKYIEMGYADAAPQVYSAEIPPGFLFTGFAAVAPKAVYGHIGKRGSGQSTSQGLYSLLFDETEKTARWVPVDGTTGNRSEFGIVNELWGADGGRLVVSRGGDPAGLAGIHWVDPVER